MRTMLFAAIAVAIVIAGASIGLMRRASAAPGDLTRVSVNSAGVEANDYSMSLVSDSVTSSGQ